MIEVRAQDAPGLLHRIGRALETAGYGARPRMCRTLGANAVDAFYVTRAEGEPLPAADAAAVAGALEGALRGSGAEGTAADGAPVAPECFSRPRERFVRMGWRPHWTPPDTLEDDLSARPSTPRIRDRRVRHSFRPPRSDIQEPPGQGPPVSEADIDATAREIRIALLEADVALPVVRAFIKQVKERAAGAEVSQALNPAQQVIKIVNEELIGILGGETRRLRFAKNPPTVIMLAGLQGAGKTTLAGKLGHWLKGQGHAPLLVACDLQRPNAVNQLSVVAERAGVARLRARAGQRRRRPGPGRQGLRRVRPAASSTTSSSSTPPAAWASTRS